MIKWTVRLYMNLARGCCGDAPPRDLIESWIFDTKDEAAKFWLEEHKKYGRENQVGLYLEHPDKVNL